MLKQTVTYVDFDDQTQTDTLYFNLTRTELFDMMDLEPRLQAWAASVAGEERRLTNAETMELLDIVKRVIKESYGIRSEDGKHFRKSEEIFQDFKDSAAYDEFVFSLFGDDGQAAQNFLAGIMPKALQDEVQAQMPKTETAELPPVRDEEPIWVRENRDPTRQELDRMSQEQLRAEFQRKLAKRNTQQ